MGRNFFVMTKNLFNFNQKSRKLILHLSIISSTFLTLSCEPTLNNLIFHLQKGKHMSKGKPVLAILLGGIVLFLWGLISHEAIPLYKNSLVKFTDESAVASAIVANAPTPGVYFMPYVPQEAKGMSAEEFEAAQQTAIEKLKHGPFVFASVRLGEMGSFSTYMLVQVIADMLTALFVALVLMEAREQSYWNRVMICVWIALAVFTMKSLPMWNWYSFSTAFTFSELIDLIGRMFFAGLVIAKFVPGKQAVKV